MAYTPPFVTQTDEPSPWNDCTWAAALMLALKATYGGVPATRAEREALRDASGDDTGGSNLTDVDRGTRARYGWTFRRHSGSFDELLRGLRDGGGALVQHMYGELPDYYTRFDRAFAAKQYSGHAAYVERYDPSTDRLWWMDPLGRGGYKGDWMPSQHLYRAMMGLGGLRAAVAKEGERRKDSAMGALTETTLFVPPRRWVVKAGTRLIGYKWDPLSGAFSVARDITFQSASSASADAMLRITQTPDPKKAPHGTFLRVSNGTYAGLIIPAGLVVLDPAPTPVDLSSVIKERDAYRAVAEERAKQIETYKRIAEESASSIRRILL